jgi:hypothetical protein
VTWQYDIVILHRLLQQAQVLYEGFGNDAQSLQAMGVATAQYSEQAVQAFVEELYIQVLSLLGDPCWLVP